MEGSVSRRSAIRRCTEADVDWMVELAKSHYEEFFDHAQARAWGLARLKEPTMAFFRGSHAFIVGHLGRRFNAPTRVQAYMTLLYASPEAGLEPYLLLRALAKWAAEQGATKLWIGTTTGYDFGIMALRLGGRLAGYTYVVDLDENENPYG